MWALQRVGRGFCFGCLLGTGCAILLLVVVALVLERRGPRESRAPLIVA